MRNLRGLFAGLFIVLPFIGLAAPALGGSASLLLDIRSGESNRDQAEVQGPPLSLGPVALVPIFEPSSGRQLWVTDGTDLGTRLVLDLCLENCSSLFTVLGLTRQVGVFSVGSNLGDHGLWRSDGTRLGTFPLVPSPGRELELCSFPREAGAAGPLILFAARAPEEQCALWRTDGTPSGTVRVLDANSDNLTSVGEQVFFESFVGGEGPALWRTDGTPEGTIRLWVGKAGPPRDLVAVGSRIFFTAAEDGRELWTSDGTIAGTVQLTRFGPTEPFVSRAAFSGEIVLQEVGGHACFLANDGSTGRELWCSDGTAAGTRQVTALAEASPFPELSTWRVERLGDRLLFPATDGISGNRWWTSDGRPQSTAPLSGCMGGCPVPDLRSPGIRLGAQVFFAAVAETSFGPLGPSTDLWVTDGTGAGTRRVADSCSHCRVGRMYALLDKLFFAADRDGFGHDLWVSDGTTRGTQILLRVDAFPGDVLPFPPVVLGGRVLLAERSAHNEPPGLWMSDGTPAGTVEVAFLGQNGLGSEPFSLVPTPTGVRFVESSVEGRRIWESRGTADTTTAIETPPLVEDLTAFGNLTLVRGTGSEPLWRTDGTPAGTFPLTPAGFEKDIPVVVGNRAVFVTRRLFDPTAVLWATDGTVGGTQKIADLPASQVGLLPAGDSAFISMFENGNNILWRTDGTSAGTREIPLPEDFRHDGGTGVAQLNSVYFFLGSDNSTSKLWRSDGTPSGTRTFLEGALRPPKIMAVHAGALYMVAATFGGPAANELGLFRSDGTEGGTVRLATFPGTSSVFQDSPESTSVGGLLFFVLKTHERGSELWRTDGTSAGTFLVRDIVPGAESASPRQFTGLNHRLYFAASSPGFGRELWESDGTEGGTRVVQDIAPGALSSHPQELVAGGGRLFFTADDGVHGREPWVYIPGAKGCGASDTVLCLGGGRFKVEADWRDFAGRSGRGRAVSLTQDTGYFWFFDAANVEVILKVLNGQGLNEHHWVFFGALSSVRYTLTVTDTESGAVRRYFNPAGRLGSVADTQAFGPLGASAANVETAGPDPVTAALIAYQTAGLTGNCEPSTTRLCLNGGRFAVEARWRDFQGNTGTGRAVPLGGGDTGYFWFFGADNVEVVLKVLDGRPLNGKFWVFYGALSNVEYTLTVTDTMTGAVKTYTNPSGRLASVADTAAF